MATIVEMPRLSDTMTEGTLASWKKVVGEAVKAGEAFAEIETDKAVMVFESFDAGVLLATLLGPGDTVALGTPMAILGKAGEDVAQLVAESQAKVKAALAASGAAATPASEPAPPAAAPAPGELLLLSPDGKPSAGGSGLLLFDNRAESPESGLPATKAKSSMPDPASGAGTTSDKRSRPDTGPAGGGPLATFVDADGRRVPASPLARRIAAARGLDLGAVAGSGPRGRVVAHDLEGLAPPRRLSDRLKRVGRREDEVVRVTQMRKTIAKRLVASMAEAPHYYLTITVDASRLVALRNDVNEALATEGLKLSFNDFVMRGAVLALAKHPAVNAAWEGGTIRRFAGVHLGFAVALPEGLITPVIRDADTKDLITMAKETRALAAKARDQQLDSADYSGNSFCVSNLGMYGIDHFTAVINPPAACILAVGAVVEAPLVKAGQVVAGHTLTMTMSCDHRAVDGATGAAFLQDLKKVLEAPTQLVL